MRRIGRDKVQLAGVTALGAFGFLVLFPLLSAQEAALPRGWSPPAPGRDASAPPPVLSALEVAQRAPAPTPTAPLAHSRAPEPEPPSAEPAPPERPAGEPEREPGQAEESALVTISGHVVDPDGRLVVGARVIVRGGQDEERPDDARPTDAQGRFELHLRPGQWTVWAEAEGFAPSQPDRVRVRAGRDRALQEPLQLQAAGWLVGLVHDAAGRAIVGAKVETDGRGGRAVQTDEQGRFRMLLAEGTWTVRAGAPGFVPARARQVPVAANTGGEVELQLESGAALEGLVLDADGRPLAQAFVFVYREGRRLGEVQTDAEGRFQRDGLEPGPVELFTRSDDRTRCARDAAQLRAGVNQLVTLRLAEAARVAGTVRDAAGQPLAEVQVQARSVAGDVRREGVTDAQGRFVVPDLYPGRYRVFVPGRARGAPRAEAELEVVAGELRCDLVARDGGLLAGVVVGPDGQPVRAAGVFAIQGGQQRAETRTDEQGAFRLDGLPAGTYQVFSRRDQALAGIHPDVSLPEGGALSDLRVTIYPPAHLRGRVLDAAGQPVSGLELVARGRDAPVQRRARTDAQGQFEMAPFYAGAYEVSAAGDALALEARRRGLEQARLPGRAFEVVAGRDASVELRLETSAAPR